MKSIAKHISLLRGLIKEYSRNTEPYTDEYLYEVLSVSRTDILGQRLDKFVNISTDNWFRICIPLEVTKSHNCSCVPDRLACKVLRTKFKVPSVLSGRNKDRIDVALLDGTKINISTEAEWMRVKDNEFKSQFYYASFVNGYLYFWNLPLNLKVVQVTGLFADVTELSNIECNDGDTTSPCFDITTSDFPIDEKLAYIVYRRAAEILGIPLQIIQDKTNDGNQDIK